MGKPITPGAEVEDTTQFELHSDAHLRLVGPNGAALGFNSEGGIDESLSGTFLSYEGMEFASISGQTGPLKVTVNGIRDGKFTLIVRQRSAGTPAGEFMYKEIPVNADTRTELSFAPFTSGQPPPLNVAQGGSTRKIDPVLVQSLKVGSAPRGQEQPATQLGTIPSVGGTVTQFKFFTFNGEDIPPTGMRSYKDAFSSAGLGGVYFEFGVKYAADNAVTFPLTVVWKRDGETFERQDLTISKPSDYNTSTKTYGFVPGTGRWQPGRYTVDVSVAGQIVASGLFVVN
jgi:hypothetical protein